MPVKLCTKILIKDPSTTPTRTRSQAVCLYCCPDCINCQTDAVHMSWVAWEIWAAIKKYKSQQISFTLKDFSFFFLVMNQPPLRGLLVWVACVWRGSNGANRNTKERKEDRSACVSCAKVK